MIEAFNPDNVYEDLSGNKIFAGKRTHDERVKSTYMVLRFLKGESIKINNKLTIDGSKLTKSEVIKLQKKLQNINTQRTGILKPEEIQTDDELTQSLHGSSTKPHHH